MKQHPAHVLFIDFDGVTHPLCGRSPKGLDDPMMGRDWFCPANVAQVNRLMRELNAVGVVSSTWRLDFPWLTFQTYFEQRLAGQTPELFEGRNRFAECMAFLSNQGWDAVPWVALDDKPALYGEALSLYRYGGQVLETDHALGLTEADVDRFLESQTQPLRHTEETPLCDYYCTFCHRPFVAEDRCLERVRCPACRSSDFPALWKANTFGFSYYQMSEAGSAEMANAKQEWCIREGRGVALYDKSPLREDAVRIGTLWEAEGTHHLNCAEAHEQAVSALLSRSEADSALRDLAQEIEAIVRYEITQSVAPGNRLQDRLHLPNAVRPPRRTAIISDIHGNHAGLLVALADIEQQRCDRILCLGDLVDGGPENEQTVRALRDRGIACVRGNHDEINDARLAQETQQFLTELPDVIVERDVLFTHISPRDKRRKIDNVIEAWNVFEESTYRLTFVGHVHVPHVFGKRASTFGEAARHAFEYNRPLTLDPEDRYVVSVGAIGYGRDTAAKIRYCIYDAEADTVELRAIDGPLLPLDYSVARFSTEEGAR